MFPKKIVERFLFPHLSLLDDRLCDVHGFVLVAFPASLSAQSFPFIPACPEQ